MKRFTHVDTQTKSQQVLPAALLEYVRDLVFIVDPDGRILFTNAAFQQHTGIDLHDTPAPTLSDIVTPDCLSLLKAMADALLQGQTLHNNQLSLRTRYGYHLNVGGTLMTVPSDDGDVEIVGLFRPQSDMIHKLKQHALILQNISDAVIFTDPNLHILSWNPASTRIYGWSVEDALGEIFTELVPTQNIGYSAEDIRATLETRGYWRGETVQTRRDGETVYVLTSLSVIKDEQGQIAALVSINRDISERKQVEDALRRANDEQEVRVKERTLELQAMNDRLQMEINRRNQIDIELRLRNHAIESSNSAITIADATQPDLPLVYVNPAFSRITGYSDGEILGKNCRFLQGTDRDQPEIAVIREAIRQKQPCVVTLRNYRKDGTLFWNELRITPMKNADGEVTHFVGVSTDISERKRDEQRIKSQNEALIRANRALAEARQQAEAATRLKSQFLATMSHELRTPLNAVIGYTEIQLAGMTGPLNEEQRDYQERVLVNAEHLLSLINDVLDISKIEAGRVEIVHKRFHLGELLQEIVEQTRGLAQKKGLTFRHTLDYRLPAVIVGDPERLRQIALNLLSNAIKFTRSGEVKIEMRQHGHETWTLVVSDSGVGIPAHMLETIFEEFRQVDGTSQREFGGTGLGLAIVRRLALMMGGTVRVNSKIDVGSSFTVFLPLTTQEPEDLQHIYRKE